MAKAMTKSEIVAALADKVGISKKQVNELLLAQAELAYKQAKNSFVIPGIGKLVMAERPRARCSCDSDPRPVKRSQCQRKRLSSSV